MWRTGFRVNPHSIVAWMSRNSSLKAGVKSEVWVWTVATIERGFTLKHIRDMTRTYSQPKEISVNSKIYFSIWFKKTSMFGWPLGDCHLDLGVNAGISLNYGVTSLLKCHLILILLQNSSKSFFNLGPLILFWIGGKSNPFAITFISVSLKTLLKSKTVSKEKYPWMRLLTLIFSGISML